MQQAPRRWCNRWAAGPWVVWAREIVVPAPSALVTWTRVASITPSSTRCVVAPDSDTTVTVPVPSLFGVTADTGSH